MSSTVLSLFTGIGGLDLGFESAGFSIQGSIEIDPVARRTLSSNRPLWTHLEPHDIGAFCADDAAGLGQIDVITGAPPCQPFSKAAQWASGSRRGVDDERGIVIFDVLDLIAATAPKLVVLENVQGFVKGKTSVLPILEESLDSLKHSTEYDYTLDHRVVDAHAHGVPQKRRRAIVVLSRVGEFPWPDPDPEDTRPRAWDAIGDVASTDEALEIQGKWSQLLPSIPEGQNYQWHTNRGGGLPIFGYRTRYWSFLLKLAKDEPAWTIAARPGPSTGPFHWDSRRLSITELLRLQSFPSEWVVEGSRTEQVRQIGNATPPALAERIAIAAADLLDAPNQKRTLRFAIARAQIVPSKRAAEPVHADFLGLVDDHPDHPGPGRGPAHSIATSS